MKHLFIFVACALVFGATVYGQDKSAERAVIASVKMFYSDFDNGKFERSAEYSTEDWTHINPFGGITAGRDAVLKEVRAVHSTFLKGVTDTPESFNVRFAGPAVAVVLVPSRLSTFTTPDGVKHENERNVRTFVVVKQKGRWLIMQDHNKIIAVQH